MNKVITRKKNWIKNNRYCYLSRIQPSLTNCELTTATYKKKMLAKNSIYILGQSRKTSHNPFNIERRGFSYCATLFTSFSRNYDNVNS